MHLLDLFRMLVCIWALCMQSAYDNDRLVTLHPVLV
jgi:hypothetical protein